MASHIKISVIICCHNSKKTILKVLNSLFEQLNVQEVNYEIVLVDNNCTDFTTQIAKLFYDSQKPGISLTVVYEARIGLNYARSKGILNSKGEILVFCDDDNIFSDSYICGVNNLFKTYPKLGCVGPGIIEAVDENLQRLPESKRYFFQDKKLDGELILGGPDYLWLNMPAGTGMALKRSVGLSFCEKIENGLFTCKDRSGKILSSGGDTQIVYTAILLGYNVGLSDLLSLKHLTTKEKLNNRYIKRMYFGVYSCQDAHLEAWPDHRKKYMSVHLRSTLYLLFSHFFKFGHRSFRIGKLKYLIAELAFKYGILRVRCKNDFFLNFVIFLFQLK